MMGAEAEVEDLVLHHFSLVIVVVLCSSLLPKTKETGHILAPTYIFPACTTSFLPCRFYCLHILLYTFLQLRYRFPFSPLQLIYYLYSFIFLYMLKLWYKSLALVHSLTVVQNARAFYFIVLLVVLWCYKVLSQWCSSCCFGVLNGSF